MPLSIVQEEVLVEDQARVAVVSQRMSQLVGVPLQVSEAVGRGGCTTTVGEQPWLLLPPLPVKLMV